jgi:hypothetical protein
VEHVKLNVGNVVLIGGISLLTGAAVMGITHVLAHRNVPALSPAARGVQDFVGTVSA